MPTRSGMILAIGAVSAMLFFVGLWQIEEMWNHAAWGAQNYTMPFGQRVDWFVARDVWYGVTIAGWGLLAFLIYRARRFEVD